MNVGLMKKRFIFCEFSNKFSSNLLISLIQNISVLDKSRKFVSCVRENYENQNTNAFQPINSILYKCKRFIIDREGIMKIKHKCFSTHQFNSLQMQKVYY